MFEGPRTLSPGRVGVCVRVWAGVTRPSPSGKVARPLWAWARGTGWPVSLGSRYLGGVGGRRRWRGQGNERVEEGGKGVTGEEDAVK